MEELVEGKGVKDIEITNGIKVQNGGTMAIAFWVVLWWRGGLWMNVCWDGLIPVEAYWKNVNK